jgi:hypothetical protein
MKILSILLLSALPTVMQAQFTFTTNNDGSLNIASYTGSGGAVIIPDTTNGLPVSSIGDWVFYASSITNVLIPDSVINIGDGAFFDCESLANVTIGSNVTNIGDWTFAFCSSLMSVCCRGDAPSLGGGNVFYGNLATIYYLSGATGWGPMFDGHPAILWNPPVPYTYTTSSDGITLTITGYTGSGGAVTIPDSINFLPVTSLGNYAFFLCTSLTSITIPNSVTSIGDYAFDDCSSLTSITIPNSVTNIGDEAFLLCSSLTSITIPNSVTSIGDNTFGTCTSLASVTIPNSVTSIGFSSFNFCLSLVNISIPDSVTSIGDAAFNDCTSLTNIIIPNSVSTIGNNTFGGCTKLTSITIPNSVTNIEDNAFYDCFDLVNVTIPDSVTSIGGSAFYNCTSLTSVYFKGNAPNADSTVFWLATGTVYYLPGTMGWGATFGGLPTALWPLPNPVIVNSGRNFGVQTNVFGFNIAWATNLSVVVEACTNLADPVWQRLETNTLISGWSNFSDPNWTNYPSRFYRLNSP